MTSRILNSILTSLLIMVLLLLLSYLDPISACFLLQNRPPGVTSDVATQALLNSGYTTAIGAVFAKRLLL
jgi:hypothetical protein